MTRPPHVPAAAPAPTEAPARAHESGYTLVALVVVITLMHVALATILPLYSTQVRREREEEAIFRGLQYAEAIRVFNARFGRYPTQPRELIELEPRSIRQLWTDPLSEGGRLGFGLLVETQQNRRSGRRNRGGTGPETQNDGRGGAGPGGAGDTPVLETITLPGAVGEEGSTLQKIPPPPPGRRARRGISLSRGPIQGVYLTTGGEAVKLFNEAGRYEQWYFTASMIVLPSLLGADQPLPDANSDRIGRPWTVGLDALSGPEGAQDGEDERTDRRRRRRDRNRDAEEPRGPSNRRRRENSRQ